jgi:hypothetical protein
MQDSSNFKFLRGCHVSQLRVVLMSMSRYRRATWIAVVVLLHFFISVVHGTAHANANIPLSAAANVFVLAVIVAGPLIGLGLLWPAERIGAWLIALTMAGAFVFGVVNHFMLESPDHIGHVIAQWRPLFTTTAVLLALTEALGAGLAVQTLRGRRFI